MTVGISELPPEGMQLGGVALAGDADRGTRTTEGLSLLFTTAGITVQGPQPQIERLLVWSGLDTATCGEKIVLPDGRDAAIMELTSGGQSIRFLLPTDAVTPGQAAYLDQALPGWLARYKGSAEAPPPPGPPPQAARPADRTLGGVGPTPGGQPTAPADPSRGVAAASGVAAAGMAAGAAGANGAPAAARPAAAGPGTAAPPAGPPPAGTGTAAPTAGPPPAGSGTAAPTAGPPPTGPAPAPVPPPPPDAASTPVTPPPPPSSTPPGPVGTAGPPPPPVEGTAGFVPVARPAPPAPVFSTPLATGYDIPPPGQAAPVIPPPPESVLPTKKTRAWRKASPPAGTGPVPPPGVLAPQPPAHPPTNPVPLTSTTLPPPPPEGMGATGTPGWAPSGPGTGGPVSPAPAAPSARGRRRRKAARAEEIGATGILAATGFERAEGPPIGATPTAPTAPTGPSGAPSAPSAPGPAGAPDGPRTPGGVAAPPAAGPPYAAAPPTGSTGVTAPAGPGGPSGPPTTGPRGTVPPPPIATKSGRPKNNRTVVFVLVAVLVVVIAAIVFLVVRKNGSTTATTQPSVTSPSAVVADLALATSINLRLADLPSGWSQTPVGPVSRPPVAPAGAQVQANRALAACVGVDYPIVAGLFGGSVLPGQTSAVRSPNFASGSDPNIQMYSMTTIMSTPAQTQALAAPFDNPNFANCYGQYQSSLVSAAVPGASAQVQVVTLTTPTGVRSFGYLTTLTIPNQGSEVVGQAFMLGGRIETRLQPSTNGPPVPSDVFNPAYNAVVGRISRALNN